MPTGVIAVDGLSLKVKAAHLRLEDEAVVLVPVKPAFNLLPTTTRLQILEELITASKAERLQGEVIPVWALPDGTHLGFLAEPRLHARMKAVTLARVLANLNRVLRVTTPSTDLNDSIADTEELAPAAAQGLRVATRRIRPEAAPASAAASSTMAGGGVDVHLAHDPFADVQAAPTFSVLQTPSGRFAHDQASASVRPSTPMMSSPSRSFGPASPDNPTVASQEHRVPANERLLRLVTMVFTDIVGSTEMKQRLGEHRAMELIQWHHGVVREVLLQSQTGEEVSTAGDSFFLVFSSPSDAVRFALRLQARLRVGPGQGFVIFDRIGIHVGEVFLTVESVAGKVRDYYGMQVDTCARVMSLAGSDQILMTRFAADNARQTLRNLTIPGLNPLHWVCHGQYLVKGVDEPIEVFEVGERGLAAMHTPSPDKRLHY
jgi:class 3 adenylate cyclase